MCSVHHIIIWVDKCTTFSGKHNLLQTGYETIGYPFPVPFPYFHSHFHLGGSENENRDWLGGYTNSRLSSALKHDSVV